MIQDFVGQQQVPDLTCGGGVRDLHESHVKPVLSPLVALQTTCLWDLAQISPWHPEPILYTKIGSKSLLPINTREQKNKRFFRCFFHIFKIRTKQQWGWGGIKIKLNLSFCLCVFLSSCNVVQYNCQDSQQKINWVWFASHNLYNNVGVGMTYEAEPSNEAGGGTALKVPTKMKDKKKKVDPIMDPIGTAPDKWDKVGDGDTCWDKVLLISLSLPRITSRNLAAGPHDSCSPHQWWNQEA